MDTKDTKGLRPNAASHAVIEAAMKVHTVLGAGMLESTICACLIYEFNLAGLHVQHQVRLPVVYGEITLPGAYRVDFIIEECLMVEIKCVEKLLPVHHAQLMTYLKVSHFKLGLLINFNVPHLRDGIRRIINGREDEL
ncbi:MAG TPA: GxxExxY protein [Vicinamibacterales bacterium]